MSDANRLIKKQMTYPSSGYNSTQNLLAGKVSAGKDADAHNLMGDQTPDTHHCGASVVELNSALLQFLLVAELVPSKVKGAASVITDELGGDTGDLAGISVADLSHNKEGGHLVEHHHAIGGLEKGREGGKAIGDVLGTGEANTGGGGQVSDDGKHGDAAVLQLTLTEGIELGLGTVLAELKGVKIAQRRHGAELLAQVGTEGSGGLAGLSGSKGSSASDEGGNDGRLEHDSGGGGLCIGGRRGDTGENAMVRAEHVARIQRESKPFKLHVRARIVRVLSLVE